MVVLRLSPCLECSLCSFGNFPGVWSLKADVSELNVGSIVLGDQEWPTLSSETSAFKLQTPGKFPKEHRLQIRPTSYLTADGTIRTVLFTWDESWHMVLVVKIQLTGRVTPQIITNNLMLSKKWKFFHDYVKAGKLFSDTHAVWLTTSVVQEINRNTKTPPL